jgi:hypothetical protein
MQLAWLMKAWVAVLLLFSAGCGVWHGARPPSPGEQVLSLTLGGPLLKIPGVAKMPLPNATVEYGRGITERLGVGGGVHLVAAAFGVLGGHAQATYLALAQRGRRPALAVTNRLYAFSNHLDGRKPAAIRSAWFVHQLDVLASWLIAERHLIYTGLGQFTDFSLPQLLPSLVLGSEHRFAAGRFAVAPELRWTAPHIDQSFGVIDWLAPDDLGGVFLTLGLAWRWGA